MSDVPLIPQGVQQKPRTWFGYLPVWSECVPLIPETGKVDWVRVTANVIAGCVIGIRQTLSAIVSATLVFTTTNNAEILGMFPFGISMMWYSTMLGSAWYGVFGRLQYNTNATQEVCAILYGVMANRAAIKLEGDPDRIPATVLALIVTSTVLTGACSFALGKLGVGKLMLRFPAPVTSGFLGCIGFFLVRTALQVASGVTFQYFYPVDLVKFCSVESLAPVACLLGMVAFMRKGPAFLKLCFPHNATIKKLSGLICQLLPLAVFYAVVFAGRISIDALSETGWTYPAQSSHGFSSLWTSYNLYDADFGIVLRSIPDMCSLVVISVLCTMTGVLGITGKFPSGPDGDPSPLEVVDFDGELTVVGVGAVLSGLSFGVITFHRLGSSVQLRLDGGTHRLAVMSSAAFVGFFFFSSLPLGHFIPKWFLGGLFMGSGISFLEGALLSFRSLPWSHFLGKYKIPSPQYAVTLCCILVAVFSTPFEGIGAGLAFSIVLFLWQSSESSPLTSMSNGSSTVSRTFRPFWELRTLRHEGSRIIVLYLQGQLFFGSGQSLSAALVRAVENPSSGEGLGFVQSCILSFSKVESIDASAAEQLKTAIKRVKRHGCKVIFCRMCSQVFEMLSAYSIIESPDSDLRHVLDLNQSEELSPDASQPELDQHLDELQSMMPSIRPSLKRAMSFRAMGNGEHDAFDHETDALAHCEQQLLSKFCYGATNSTMQLEAYMKNYGRAYISGTRLPEEVFEKMNQLSQGTMGALRPFCSIQTELAPMTELHKREPALYFVLQGGLALVDVRHSAGDEDGSPSSSGGLAMKGFHGRGGKRLRKRYPPGSLVGCLSFFLKGERLVDTELLPSIIVSGKFAKLSEIWTLTRERWAQLPEALKRELEDMLMLQLVSERQHTLLSGE